MKLLSSNMVYAPGIIRWAQAHYDTDRETVCKVVAETWHLDPLVAGALAAGHIEWTTIGEDVEFYPPLILRRADVLAAAERDFAELQACKEITSSRCTYVGRCAIGNAMAEEVRSWFDSNDATSLRSHNENHRILLHPEERESLCLLQNVHDALITQSVPRAERWDHMRAALMLCQMNDLDGLDSLLTLINERPARHGVED